MRQNHVQPALLTRQLWLLAAVAGVFASRYFWPSVFGLFLIVIHQHWRFTRGWRAAVPLLGGMALCFALGAGYAFWRGERPMPLPEWAAEASSQSAQHLLLERDLAGKARPESVWDVADNRLRDESGGPDKDGAYRRGLRLAGRVAEVEARVDRELRLILEDVRPLDFAGEALPGRVAFTWRDALSPEGRRPPPPDTPAYLRRELPGEALSARPLPGQEVELQLRLRRVRGLMNPGLWEVESYWADRGVTLRAWEQGGNAWLLPGEGRGLEFRLARAREVLRQRVLKFLPHDGEYLRGGAEILPALLFDDRYLMDSHDSELFARSTLTHSLALSGMHLGYAAALGYFAVFLLYRWRPELALRWPRRKAAVIGGGLPALGYIWLGGAPPSLLRAALMLAFAGWVFFRGRPVVLADALVWAVAAILLWEPLAAFDLRLQLSALCIAALAWAQPLFSRTYESLRGKGLARRILRGAVLLLLSTLVIQLALAPLLVKTFGLYGLAMPLNVIWLPVLGFAVMPCAFLGLGAAGMDWSAPAEFFFWAAALPCGALLELLRGMDSAGFLPALLPPRPHWVSMFGFWFLLLLIGRKPSKLKLALGAALCVLPLLLPAPAGVALRVLDVGQGQAVLVEWSGGRLLVDGGGTNSPRFDVGREVVAAHLAQGRAPSLDYMLASHLDVDHAGGLVFPLRHLPVKYYADNGGKAESPRARELLRLIAASGLERNALRAGDFLDLGGGLGLEVLHPALPRGEVPANPNRDSLVLRLVWKKGGQSRGLALICGDVDQPAQRAILRRLGPDKLAAEVLVLPHHGSASSLVPAFYRAAAPRLAVASCGYGNIWNFPSPAVKNALLDEKIPLLSSAAQGQIFVMWEGPETEMRLDTARSGALGFFPEKK